MCASVMTKDGVEICSTDGLRAIGFSVPGAKNDCLCSVNLPEILGEGWIDVNIVAKRFPCYRAWPLIEYLEMNEDGLTYPELRPLSRKERKMMKNRAIRQQSQRR